MNYRPKKGDRVRVVLEGPVTGSYEDDDGFNINDANFIEPSLDHVVSIEKLPDPEPEWQPGDVVCSTLGSIYQRRGDEKWTALGLPYAQPVSHGYPIRPLTLLVRDGKPVVS